MTILGVTLAVPTADLILMKIFAAGSADEYDIVQLLEIGPRSELIADVDAKISSFPNEMRRRWEALRSRL